MLTLITCTPLGTSKYRLLLSAEQISPSYDGTPSGDGDGNEGTGDTDGSGQQPTEEPKNDNLNMPANSPSFFEQIWQNIFGS